jgi:DNA-binding SARP family transcriptional activator
VDLNERTRATQDTDWPPRGTRWHIRLLGRLEVASPSNDLARFRSKTALSLLAFLALNKSKECSSEQLENIFWPESDGDRQGQNLRRAIADLRSVLEEGLPLGSIVATRRGHVSLCADRVATDVERFVDLTSQKSHTHEQDHLSEAVSLYAGPLLAPLADDWVVSNRMELEERFGQAVGRLCEMLVHRGKVKEAVRIGRNAVIAAPCREDVHIGLMRTYVAADMSTEALRQFEELERLLDETWGEVPSERARQALASDQGATPARANIAPLASEEPSGGAMPLGSRYYVRRAADADAEGLVEQGEGVVLIQGPRQVGKSSLLARTFSHARSAGIKVILTDLQAMGKSQFLESELLYRTLAHNLAQQLGLDIDLEKDWSVWLGPNMNLDGVVGRLLGRCDGLVCWGIDEADLLFDRPYTNDFFGLLRSWHNRRALEPNGAWHKLTLVLTYATEAHLFISDLNQSPFNVGVRLALQDFSEREMRELQGRYSKLSEHEAWRTVHRMTHGHPYLARQAFAFLAKGGKLGDLEANASKLDGPFGDHLRRTLASISKDREILGEVRRMLRGEEFENPTTRYRLWSAGILSISKEGGAAFRVPAYGPLLAAELG